jgi:soluble lytic murein transglycosylase-like protein
MRVESGGRTMLADDRKITSRAGAVGIMQVMPGTYDEMAQQYGLGSDRYDPHDNVFAGAAYLRWLHDRYGFPAMFAAYNGGPGTLDANLRGEEELPKETRNYLASVTNILDAPHRRTRARG